MKRSNWEMVNIHRSQIGSYNCLNCYMRVVYYIFTSTPGVVRFHFRTNPRTQVFWENQFFSFCGVPKNIFWPQKPYLALESPTFGGSYFYNFLIQATVLELEISKTAIFGHKMKKKWFSQKTWVLGFVRKWIRTTPGALVKM